MPLSRFGLAALLTLAPALLAADPAQQEADGERTRAANHPLIVVQDHAWAPLAFRDEAGRPQGLLVDLWRAVGKELGREVRFELVDWQQSLDRVRTRQNRIHGGLFHSPEREAYLDFSSDLVQLRTALFVATDGTPAKALEPSDLQGTTVGVTSGGYEAAFMREHHPGLSLQGYPNNEQLVRAAASGDIQAFVADYPVGMYYLGRHSTPERFRVLSVLYRKPLRAAVAAGNADLLAEVERGLNRLSSADRARINQKWVHTEHIEALPSWLLPALAATAVAIALLWLATHNRLLQARVAQQTRALVEREGRLSLLTENMTDVVWSVTAERRYSYVSPSIQRLTGYRPEDIVGKRMGGTITTESVEQLTEHIRQARQQLRSGEHSAFVDFTAEAALLRRDGTPVWTEVASRVFFDEQGRFTGMQGVTREITERRRSQETIKRLAYYDFLTELPNRRMLDQRLAEIRNESAGTGYWSALLFLDLDHFKTLNDTRGHHIGDQLLQAVANRLRGNVRESDMVVRLGGDEFVVVLHRVGDGPGEARTYAERVAGHLLHTVAEPYEIAGRAVHISPSIGATVFQGFRTTGETVLRQADMAMYEAKLAGRNTLCFYEPRMQVAIDTRASLEAALRIAVQEQQFTLHYQPLVEGRGTIAGAEGLVRWHHPERGLVSPGEFIPLAEETGLITNLGRWVLETAAHQLAEWANNPATAGLTLSVNLSARQFEQDGFVDEVSALLERTDINPRLLKLELTESSILQDVDAAIAKMTRLRARGVGFALDDFGTGYSSLAYLKRLPLDQLKIDKSFVQHILTDADDAAIARTIIALGQLLELPVVAEGVETQEQHQYLAEQGCNAFQGFLFGRPQPMDAFLELLTADGNRANRC